MKSIIAMLLLLSVGLEARWMTMDRLVSVYDGDTFRVDLKCNTKVLCKNIPIRVYGVDTPELRTKSSKEKELAVRAQLVTMNFLMNNDIILNNCIRGKYFRLVCEVKSADKELGKVLLEEGLAVEYYGGKKIKDWSK